MLLKLIAACLLISRLQHLTFAASPSPKNSKAASNSDCSGVVAFCSTGYHSTHGSGLIRFKTAVYDRAAGWNQELGTYTVLCPGVYHVFYTGRTDTNSRLVLKKRPATKNASWFTLVSTPPGGGSNAVIVHLSQEEQISVFAVGTVMPDIDSSTHITSFSAFRLDNK